MFVHRKQGLMDDIKMAGKKQKKAPMWKKLTKTCGHWRTHIISWPCILGLYSAWMQTEWINNWTKKDDVWIAYFCWVTEKLLGWEKPHAKTVASSHDMEGHASKMRWAILRAGKQESGATVQSFKSLPGWSSIQAGGTRISWRTVRSLLSNCLEMFVSGTNWTTWHLVVGQWACKISHHMDSCMWQTIAKADFIHSSHKRFPTILSCVRTRHSIVDWFFSRLRLCWWSWGLKINFRRWLVYVWKWRTFVPVSWMCKKQTAVSHSSTESEIISLDARFRVDGLPAHDLWDFGTC